MLIIVRHGQSMTNAQTVSRFNFSDDNNVLTVTGVQGAINVGEWMKEHHPDPDLIVTSGLARAKQTGFLIASVLKSGVPFKHNIVFEEIRWYDSEGIFRHYTEDVLFNCIDTPPRPDAECQRDVYERVIPHFLDLARDSIDKTYVLVCHYFVVRAIQSFLESGGPSMMPTYDPSNTTPYVITDEEIVRRI